jgi:hypothetical protein
MQIISLGGGIQSSALVVLNALGKVDPPVTHAVFADTGAELPKTYEWLSDQLIPWMLEHGVEFHTVTDETYWPLDQWQVENKKILIPMYGGATDDYPTGGMMRRQCTYKVKILPVRRWLRAQGAKQATVQLGISLDEGHRAKDSTVKWCVNRYPLIDLRLTRADCAAVLEEQGLPLPPKSACYMCPYRRKTGWEMMRENDPDVFEQAVEFERAFDNMFLYQSRIPLDQTIGQQLTLFEDDECGGYCWT